MQNKKKHHRSALALLFAFTAVIAAGCGCDEDKEFDSGTACNMLVDAANGVLTSCGQPTLVDTEVCGYASADCISNDGCSPKVDVNTCVASIKALDCTNITATAYSTLAGCAGVYTNIADTCTPNNSGGSDWDDWD